MAGWWWSSSSPSSSSSSPSSPSLSASTSQHPQDQEQASGPTSASTSTAQTKAQGQDQQAMQELRALFESIDPERAAKTDAAFTKSQSTNKQQQQQQQEEEQDSLYPDSMRCAACFDQAYYCSSLGGQLTNIYRYGGMRSCTDLWAQWRFCMRTKTMSAAERRQRIREWEQRKVAKYKVGRSSEDVWAVRRREVERPFGKDLDAEDEAEVLSRAEC